MRRVAAILAGLLALAAPQAAGATDAEPRVDPRPGSPSEAIYGIQLDRERRDAAPGGRSGQASRSELGVGSSARVPGTPLEGDHTAYGPSADPPSDLVVAALLILLAGAAIGGGYLASAAVRRAAAASG